MKSKIHIAEERWLKSYCDLELIDGFAVKTFHKNFPKHLNDQWIKHYNEFRMWNDTPVKIHEIKDNKIVMDYIPGSTTAVQWIYKEGTTQSRLAEVASCIYQLCADMLNYCNSNQFLFYHEDLNLTNFMVHDNKITLVDPESFVYSKTINYNALVQPHINLSKVAHKIIDGSIENTKFF